jgi:DNA polymerase III alpha subunit (gram-positive type)
MMDRNASAALALSRWNALFDISRKEELEKSKKDFERYKAQQVIPKFKGFNVNEAIQKGNAANQAQKEELKKLLENSKQAKADFAKISQDPFSSLTERNKAFLKSNLATQEFQERQSHRSRMQNLLQTIGNPNISDKEKQSTEKQLKDSVERYNSKQEEFAKRKNLLGDSGGSRMGAVSTAESGASGKSGNAGAKGNAFTTPGYHGDLNGKSGKAASDGKAGKSAKLKK